MRDWAAELVERARSEGVELTGDNGLLTALVRRVLQTGLEVEMTDHVGYEPHALEGHGSGNSRNGTYPKTVTTEIGKSTCGSHVTATAPSTRSPSARDSAASMGLPGT
jgi:transposase-like protein